MNDKTIKWKATSAIIIEVYVAKYSRMSVMLWNEQQKIVDKLFC